MDARKTSNERDDEQQPSTAKNTPRAPARGGTRMYGKEAEYISFTLDPSDGRGREGGRVLPFRAPLERLCGDPRLESLMHFSVTHSERMIEVWRSITSRSKLMISEIG